MFTYYSIIVFVFFCLGGCNGLFAEIELAFVPNRPVQQESRLTIQLQQSLPGMQLQATMQERLMADVKMVDRADLPINRPPFNLLFTLKDLTVCLQTGDKQVEYQVNKPNTSLFLAEIHDMIDKPIKLYFDEKCHLLPHTPGIVQLAKELPLLSQIHPQSLAEELFQHQFSLAGRPLIVNKSYTILLKGMGMQPKSLIYTITSINDQEIVATLKGDIPSTSFAMQTEVLTSNILRKGIRLTVDGLISGEIRWSRSNALLYALKLKTIYRGIYLATGFKGSLNLEMQQEVDTCVVDPLRENGGAPLVEVPTPKKSGCDMHR